MPSDTGETDLAANDIRLQAAQHTLAANPLVGIRGQDIVDAASVLLAQTACNPWAAARQYLSFLGELGRIVTGGSELAPDNRDRRFTDPAWKGSAAYRALAQCYLAWGGALNRLVDDARMEERMRRAPASSLRSSWTRCRRPTRWEAIPPRLRGWSTRVARVSCAAWKTLSAT